jgi:hypothetical protein
LALASPSSRCTDVHSALRHPVPISSSGALTGEKVASCCNWPLLRWGGGGGGLNCC